MNNRYDFSVIIPAHNNINIINSALDSIINQNYDLSKVEVIIVDDGSSDNLKEWVQGYLYKFSNIKYFYKEYGKLGSVINYVINNNLATGEYITILNPSDKFTFNCFTTVKKYFNKNVDLILSDFYVWKIKETKSGKVNNRFIYQKIIFSRSKKQYVKRKNIEKARTPWAITLCKFYKNELFYLMNNSIENSYFQDTILFNEVLDRVHVVKYINKALGWWRNDFQLLLNKVNWNDEECHQWLDTIHNLANGNGKFIALLYIFYYRDFRKYLSEKNIKIRISGKINLRWVPFGLRTLVKLIFLLLDHRYIDH